MARWETCREGCGLQHKFGDADPVHSANWLNQERARLMRELDERREDFEIAIFLHPTLPNQITGHSQIRKEAQSAVFCEHANEVPQMCPCEPGCYCKSHTCKGLGPFPSGVG